MKKRLNTITTILLLGCSATAQSASETTNQNTWSAHLRGLHTNCNHGPIKRVYNADVLPSSNTTNSAIPEIISPLPGVISNDDATPIGEGAMVTFRWTSPPEANVVDWAIYVGSELGAWDYRRITHMNRYSEFPEEEALKIGIPADGRTIFVRLFWRPNGEEHQYIDLEYVTPTFNVVDTDGDGIPDSTDSDDDNDGVPDTDDAFPLDPNESMDTDGDLIGNNSDPDDDNDGVLDDDDAFPLDPSESVDTDGDGIGNNADPDDDNDGVVDANDAFPLDASQSAVPSSPTINNNSSTASESGGGGSLGVPFMLALLLVLARQFKTNRRV